MIVVLKKNITTAELDQLAQKLRELDCRFEVVGNGDPIIRIFTKQTLLSGDFFLSQPGVQDVLRITPPYELVKRDAPNQSTSISVGDLTIAENHFTIVAGPCAVESEEQISGIAKQLSSSGVRFLRGGAFKPRTSPYSFQGLKEDGLRMIRKAADQFQMKVVTEVVSSGDVTLVSEYADIVQIGTRNMQNFQLLKTAGKQKKPVLLKRGMNATIDEFLLAAEYILQSGNRNVILCERGIRTFEKATRNTLDISAVPLVKQLSHLPIFVDPSHASGKRSLILPLSRAALAVGADGLLIEVHHQAEAAKSDGPQSIDFEAFEEIKTSLSKMAPLLGKTLL
jgi:3-deoxy-7-phosphoheptulonate synthase